MVTKVSEIYKVYYRLREMDKELRRATIAERVKTDVDYVHIDNGKDNIRTNKNHYVVDNEGNFVVL
jgi:hypothetical protein